MPTFSEIQEFKQKLKSLWSPSTEECGVISQDYEIVPKENRSKTPENNFEFQMEDIEGVLATWHTHPSGTANLSIPDYRFFQSWPEQLHFIISKDEVRCYTVAKGLVYLIDQEKDHSVRPPEGQVSA